MKTKSSPPINTPTITLTAMTTSVNRVTSCRVGQVTFLSSSRVSVKKDDGVVITYLLHIVPKINLCVKRKGNGDKGWKMEGES